MASAGRNKIPFSVVVLTRNESVRIGRCLAPLKEFEQVIVLDSHSTDDTASIARSYGAEIVDFTWNGQYPKKRQWALDYLALRHDWVLFLDADEVLTADLVAEASELSGADLSEMAGYFIRGLYVREGKVLRYGAANNKLALMNRRKMQFPVIDDTGLPGLGEVEGHYQAILKSGCQGRISSLKSPLLHYAYEGGDWTRRHQGYAAWEKGMNARKAWPQDPVRWRQFLKQIFRALPCRGEIAFIHSYFMKAGFLDGAQGFGFAYDRWRYYRMISTS